MEPWRTTRVVLETGGWWEVLPSDMEHFEAHASAYVASSDTNPEARDRVRKVWLEHQYAPAWREFREIKHKPLPPHRRQVAPQAPKLPEQSTAEIVAAMNAGAWREEPDETDWG